MIMMIASLHSLEFDEVESLEVGSSDIVFGNPDLPRR